MFEHNRRALALASDIDGVDFLLEDFIEFRRGHLTLPQFRRTMALSKTATKKRISGTGTVDALATRCLRLGLIYDRTDLRLNRLKVNTRFSIDVRQDRTHFLLQFCDWGEIGLGSGRRKALRHLSLSVKQ
jgi:hypothetical protein